MAHHTWKMLLQEIFLGTAYFLLNVLQAFLKNIPVLKQAGIHKPKRPIFFLMIRHIDATGFSDRPESSIGCLSYFITYIKTKSRRGTHR